MSASENPQPKEGGSTSSAKTIIDEWLSILLFFAGIVNFFFAPITDWLNPQLRQWIKLGISIVLVLLAIFKARRWFLLKRVHFIFGTLAPWLIVFVLFLSIITVTLVWLLGANPPHVLLKNQPVPFDSARGEIFNSWQDPQSGHSKRIQAWGMKQEPFSWEIADNGLEGSFAYALDPAMRISEGASSGGYMTFYSDPVDRRTYRRVAFFSRTAATCQKGGGDLGLRLVVDDPRDSTEHFTYEIDSISNSKGTIDVNWKRFEIYLSEFQRMPRTHSRAPLPPSVDENTINKIVFFVDNGIAAKCPENTILIRDINFLP